MTRSLRVLVVLLTTFAVFAAACGDDGRSGESTSTTEATTTTEAPTTTTEAPPTTTTAPEPSPDLPPEEAFLAAVYADTDVSLPPAVTDETVLAMGQAGCAAAPGEATAMIESMSAAIPDEWKVGAPGGFTEETRGDAVSFILDIAFAAADHLCP